jgi:glutamate 5-kinase
MLIIDSGAESALLKRGKSLLPVGIKSIKGKFGAGALISILDENEKEIARGLVNFSSEELEKAIGKKGMGEAVHRDNLVIL